MGRRLTRRGFAKGLVIAPLVLAGCGEPAAGQIEQDRLPLAQVNPWGTNTFLHQDAESWRKRKTLQMVKDAGIGWIKQHFPWADIEQSGPGQYIDPLWKTSTWEKYDEIVDLAEEAGIEIVARIDRVPAWARPEESTSTEPPSQLEDFGRFIETIVARYRGRIRHYQIWNEPNLAHEWGGRRPDAAGYVDLLRTAFMAAQAIDPEVLILNAPLAATLERSARAQVELEFLKEFYGAGGGDYFHIHSANAFGLGFPPEDAPDPEVLNFRRVELSRAIMVANGDGDKPIWFNEYGWNASPPDFPPHLLMWSRVDEDVQAEWTVRGVEYARANWPWAGVFCVWFFLRQYIDVDPDESEFYFRMVDPDFTPRPVYRAVARAATGK
ncbi:MAG TPA: cellulase family glycosylhydrolase [Chloroflexota bacterium]|nr:cellulase family glycosylhydrolase [Chloroflexota bacterium]